MSHPVDLVRLDQINVQFGQNHVLQDVNLTLHKDCITTLIGPNVRVKPHWCVLFWV